MNDVLVLPPSGVGIVPLISGGAPRRKPVTRGAHIAANAADARASHQWIGESARRCAFHALAARAYTNPL